MGSIFIDQKYGWARENEALNPNLYFKDNVHLIGRDNAKLALSILAVINDNITSLSSYKNAVTFSFHRYLLQHFRITAVSVRMLVVPLILSNLFPRRTWMSVAGLAPKMSMFNVLVFLLVVDLAVILVFIIM